MPIYSLYAPKCNLPVVYTLGDEDIIVTHLYNGLLNCCVYDGDECCTVYAP